MTAPIVRRRKKPVEVTTIQWLGDNEADVQAFTGRDNFYALDPEDREGCDDPDATATVFDNLHNTWVLVYIGQHIVRGVRREFYPIAEDVLAETYETVPGADTLAHWLSRRFDVNAGAWDAMSDDDRSYWEHEAEAVRRAVARGGFRTADPKAGDGR